ncbi:Rib/alpha-like domain-containing protein, partial [Lactobacillus crispatus]
MKRLKFLETKRTPRYSMRKLNVGMASVLLGVTIFGINFTNHSVKAATTENSNSQQTLAAVLTTAERTQKATSATGEVQQGSASKNATANNSIEAATTSQSAPKTQGSAGSGASGSSVTGVASGSQDSNSPAASATSSAATASQATPETQVPAPAASQSSESANSGNATSSQASQSGTVSANHTAIGTTPSSQTVSVNETTSSATQARTLMRTLMMNLAVVSPNTENTTLPKSTQTYTLVRQPLLDDYDTHFHDGKRDGNTWVDNTVKWKKDSTLDTIFGTTSKSKPGIITSHPDKYFFGAYVDYNSSYHRVILLARSQDPTDNNLYSYTIHTGRQITSSTTATPNTDTHEVYAGTSGSKYDLIFKNYQGKSYTVILKDFEDGDWGLLPVFDGGLLDPTYYSNDYTKNDHKAETKSIGFWGGAIPQETSTKVRYVDQATGKDIVQPMEISGFGYQGFKIKGEAPTVPGYHVVSKPKFLGLAYEDGTIAPYKVGQTYDLALPDSVVIKQTVINTDGTVRATAYYKGRPLSTYYKGRALSTSTSKVLGRESNNDQMSFVTPDGKFHTYTNRISQVDDSYIYYYAKDSDPNGSEMRLHFIDVTGVNNSSYAPSDGPELDADNVQTIHGNIGENYSFTYTVPKGYDQVGTSDVKGTYSGTHHDAYVYVKKQAENSDADLINAQAGKTPDVPRGVEIKKGDEAPAGIVVAKDKDDKDTTFPEGTKVTWEKAPDVTNNGHATGKVTVTYPDKTTDTVDVTVNVVPSDADKNDVKAKDGLTTDLNKVPEANGAVTVTDPDKKPVTDFGANWTKEPDVSKPGKSTGTVEITYPDGSKETVDVPVTVRDENGKTQADKNDAKAKDGLTTDLNKVPEANGAVTVTDPDKKPVTDFGANWTKEPD